MQHCNCEKGERKSVAADSAGAESGVKMEKQVVIVGCPNVGKSVLFNALTGRYATVSNYPGTTVEVARGKMRLPVRSCLSADRQARSADRQAGLPAGETGLPHPSFEILDTPGMYSLSPVSEDEQVARRIVLESQGAVIVHVVDAKNTERMLPLTLELLEASLPVILVLNMMDEAREAGIAIESGELGRMLGIPVVEAVATEGKGLEELKAAILDRVCEKKEGMRFQNVVAYDGRAGGSIEKGLQELQTLLKEEYGFSSRSIGLLLLKRDEFIWSLVQSRQAEAISEARRITSEVENAHDGEPLVLETAVQLAQASKRIWESVGKKRKRHSWKESSRIQHVLDRLTMSPVTGFPVLFLVLYFGLYQFVGVFGGGTVVDFLEGTVFEQRVNPLFTQLFAWIPWAVLRDLFVGEYGILTLGLRYAVALILPIVSFFFIVFSVIEDTGYLPRLAMLMDRTLKKIGLSGRAVIPLVLGFGCDTMATVVTRTLPTVRERVISTLLLAIAIPCSAQLGVILALLSASPLALLIWAGVVTVVALAAGMLAHLILPGSRSAFYIEIPPLRFPKIENVVTKTYVRVKWYFQEVLPLFLAASVLIWLGQITGFLKWLSSALSAPVGLLGLPKEAAIVFIMGFLRRDYGAAGLYDLSQKGALSGEQLLVACVALTLFLPCIAQFLMNAKERGWKVGAGVAAAALFSAFFAALALHYALAWMGVVL